MCQRTGWHCWWMAHSICHCVYVCVRVCACMRACMRACVRVCVRYQWQMLVTTPGNEMNLKVQYNSSALYSLPSPTSTRKQGYTIYTLLYCARPPWFIHQQLVADQLTFDFSEQFLDNPTSVHRTHLRQCLPKSWRRDERDVSSVEPPHSCR